MRLAGACRRPATILLQDRIELRVEHRRSTEKLALSKVHFATVVGVITIIKVLRSIK